jgi:release factor glutamine methyltransferase
LNLQDLHNSITNRLKATGIPEARLESQLLLRRAFSFTKADFYSRLYDDMRDQSILANLEFTVKERLTRKPLAYILGSVEFFGRQFSVNPSVLIPRQETEVLVEHCVGLLNTSATKSQFVADVGTGSGIIAVTLAAEIPRLQVIAIDRSPKASAMALGNSIALGTKDFVNCITGDLLTSLQCQFSLIVANLPYIPTENIKTLQPEVSLHEPYLALDGGTDGLKIIEHLLAQSQSRLLRGGHIVLEIDPPHSSQVSDLCQTYFPGCKAIFLNDLNGDTRVVSIQV